MASLNDNLLNLNQDQIKQFITTSLMTRDYTLRKKQYDRFIATIGNPATQLETLQWLLSGIERELSDCIPKGSACLYTTKENWGGHLNLLVYREQILKHPLYLQYRAKESGLDTSLPLDWLEEILYVSTNRQVYTDGKLSKGEIIQVQEDK